jgi:hypothetical protein
VHRRPFRSGRSRAALLASALLLAPSCASHPTGPATPSPPSPGASPELARFVDDWLDAFARRHPSIAAGNGLHAHDDLLEDLSAPAVGAEIAALRDERGRLAAIEPAPLGVDDRVDRAILLGIIDGWLLDLETVQTWRKNPMIYASAVADGVHGLMTMESAPAATRLDDIVKKLRQVPKLVASARQNVTDPPEVWARRGAETFRGASAMLADVPLAFPSVTEPALVTALADASKGARAAMDAYAADLQRTAASSHAPFAIGEAALLARYRDEEMFDLSLSALLKLGDDALADAERQFVEAAGAFAPGKSPAEAWSLVAARHPERGHVVEAARDALGELRTFVADKKLVTLPEGEGITVAAAPSFDLGFASMHASPPLEPHPVTSFFYVTDAQPEWPEDKQRGWLEHMNFATLSIVTAHEAMPGHWVHSMAMRRTTGKVRRIWIGLNPFPQPSSGQDGWAHYAEQLVVEQGFRGGAPDVRLAQLQESIIRICRLLVSARLHAAGMTLDEGARFFEQHAHLPPPAARREAERGTYDPTNGGYFLGKRALLKLRRDVAAREGARFDLLRFHDRVMQDGIAPWWAHRQLLLPGDTGAVLD